jgi:hypothetical protein
MSAFTQYGTAVFLGVNGAATVVGTARTLNSWSHRRTTPKAQQTDGQGDVSAVGYGRPIDTLEIEFVPTSTVSGGQPVAIAAGATPIPAPGATVTLASMPLAALNGSWNYDGDAQVTPSTTSGMALRLTLRRANTVDSDGNPTHHAAIS